MKDYIVKYTSLLKNRTVVTLNDRIDLENNAHCVAIVNGKEHKYELTHNEFMVVFPETINLMIGDTIRI